MQETEFVKELESTTGKPLELWFELLAGSGASRLSDLIKWLQTHHDLPYMTAHKLTHLFLKFQEENAPRITYTSGGRTGTIHYVSKETSFDLSYEFAGGNALAIIDIPAEQQWEQSTKTPISQRTAILNSIGTQVVRDQTTSGGRFEIGSNTLTIFSR
jgi:hypothetical protein